jgi:hypothetical protein
MASIVPIVIGCIDYVAYGTILTRAMFRPKINLFVFFFARKAVDERWEVVPPRPDRFHNGTDAKLNDKTESVM